MSEPKLPVELEREVFELAAHAHSKSIPTFLLVARRVKIWLEPILYSVVVFSHPLPGQICFDPIHFVSAIQSQAIAEHVKHLYIPVSPTINLELVLASCSAVQNLVLFDFSYDADVLPFVSAMPLRRLTTVLDDLFFTAGINFTHSLFAHLTHLALLFRAEPNAQWDEWKGLALIPNLTHLAFVHERSLPVFQGALATCSALQVFVYLSSWDQGLESLAQDTRFVCMITPPFIRGWQIGARGGDDFWVRAEQFIAKRISGEVDRGKFVYRNMN